jgi:hypothetical protein
VHEQPARLTDEHLDRVVASLMLKDHNWAWRRFRHGASTTKLARKTLALIGGRVLSLGAGAARVLTGAPSLGALAGAAPASEDAAVESEVGLAGATAPASSATDSTAALCADSDCLSRRLWTRERQEASAGLPPPLVGPRDGQHERVWAHIGHTNAVRVTACKRKSVA